MTGNIRKVFGFMVFLLITVGCEKQSKEDRSSEEEVRTTQLALAEASPSDSLEISSQMIETFDEAIESSAGALVIDTSDSSLLLSENDSDGRSESNDTTVWASKWCGSNGEPLAVPGKIGQSRARYADGIETPDNINSDWTVQRTHPNFAARLFHCAMKINSGSSETVRGSYALVKGIVCALDNEGLLDFDNPGTADGVSFRIEEPCFSSKVFGDEMMNVEVNLDLTTSVLTDEENWDREIRFDNLTFNGESQNNRFMFQFRNTASVMAIRFDDESISNQSAWTFSLTSDGELRYEAKNWSIASDRRLSGSEVVAIDTRSQRLFAKGSVSIDAGDDGRMSGAFNTIDTFQGISVFIERHPDNSSLFSGTIATISGTSVDGFETRALNCNNDGASVGDCDADDLSTWNDATAANKAMHYPSCYPTDKNCGGIEPLVFKSGDEGFLLAKQSLDELPKTPSQWVRSLEAPLSFESMTTEFEQK